MNALYRHRFFPLVPQIIAMIAFGLLVVGGLWADTDDPAFAKVLRNTNLANLIVWSYWWPLIIVAAIFLGRVWCIVCPMELVTSLASRVGLKRKPPRIFRSGWIITAFYVGILFIGIHMLALNARGRQESEATATGSLAFYLIPVIYGGLLIVMLFAWRMVG